MSDPIGPGDWVECVQNRLPDTLPPIGLVVGRRYVVSDVGVTGEDDAEPRVPWIRVVGARVAPGKLGFRAAWFRRCTPPDPVIIGVDLAAGVSA